MYYAYFNAPFGRLLLTGKYGLEGLYFPESRTRPVPEKDWVYDDIFFSDARAQLTGYFQGTRKQFDLDLRPEGTAFQKRVWSELQKIPYAQTITYGELAGRIGNPRACRAVGAANGRNPISIIMPCHRVIGADGSMTGFGGGVDVKKFLLDMEQAYM